MIRKLILSAVIAAATITGVSMSATGFAVTAMALSTRKGVQFQFRRPKRRRISPSRRVVLQQGRSM